MRASAAPMATRPNRLTSTACSARCRFANMKRTAICEQRRNDGRGKSCKQPRQPPDRARPVLRALIASPNLRRSSPCWLDVAGGIKSCHGASFCGRGSCREEVIPHSSFIRSATRRGPAQPLIDGARCRPTGRTGAPQEAVRGFALPTKDGDRPLKPRRSLSLLGIVTGRVGVWGGGGRTNISVAAPIVWRCLTGSTMVPFPHPAHRTGHADLPHPALGQDFTPFLSRATPSAASEHSRR